MKNLVILSGAGMSAESGISTFRDAGGLWDKYPVEQVATPEGYARNPELVINFYNERRKQLLDVVPNAGHLGVADLERDFNVTVVTQNVDNLHERAGSTHVIHLHGELTKVCSSRDPYNPHFVKELAPEEYEVKLGDKAGDGTQLRPFIVWFGESVPEMRLPVRYGGAGGHLRHHRHQPERLSRCGTAELRAPCRRSVSDRPQAGGHARHASDTCHSKGSFGRGKRAEGAAYSYPASFALGLNLLRLRT